MNPMKFEYSDKMQTLTRGLILPMPLISTNAVTNTYYLFSVHFHTCEGFPPSFWVKGELCKNSSMACQEQSRPIRVQSNGMEGEVNPWSELNTWLITKIYLLLFIECEYSETCAISIRLLNKVENSNLWVLVIWQPQIRVESPTEFW